MTEVLTAKDIYASESISIFVDRENRRVWVPFPISAAYFEDDGPIMRLSREVCGDDAVVVGDIGPKIQAMAISARDVDFVNRWRRELGIKEIE